jgi:predicted glycoside hydrolase/deacetylase ChbG (UPF0249 family)
MAEARIRLVTRGDDCGMCQSANAAVREAFEQGILRNTSVMVPCPAFEEAARMLADLPGLCVGLHVTLNAEWDSVKWGPVLPAAKVPSLVDREGLFLQTTMALQERQASGDEMIAEVRAQLDLARARGLDVRYVDQHMGVGWLAGLAERISRLAEEEGLIESGKAVRGLPRADGGSADRAGELLARLAAAASGTYLFVTHPGYDRPDMRRFRHEGLAEGQVARERDADRRAFTDQRVLDYCAANGVQPIRFTEIAAR